MKKVVIGMLLALAMASQAFAANVGNSELMVKVFGLYLSTSPLCTSPVTVMTSASPAYQDLVAAPTLFSGNIDSGTYPCIILEVSDQWKIKPTATSTTCVSGTEYTYDVCSTGISTDNLSGVTVPCTTGEDHIFIYMSTAATGNPDTIMGVFQKPTVSGDNLHGYNLANAFQVAGSVTSTLTVANVLSASLQAGGGSCTLANSPHFLFQ